MAIALDASTPGRWSGTPANAGTIVSGSFTAPIDSYLTVVIEMDTDAAQSNQVFTVTDSGGGITWGQRVERTDDEATAGGQTTIWTGRVTTLVSRTVTVTRTSGNSGTNRRVSAVCYVHTGVDVGGTPFDAITANNEGGSGTNNLSTTSVTPGADGVLIAAGTEWNALGACTSSDLKGVDGIVGSSHAEYAGSMDVMDGWKACSSGVGVTGNLDAFGAATAQWKWVTIVLRAAPTATLAARFPNSGTRPAPFKPMGDAFRSAKYKDWR